MPKDKLTPAFRLLLGTMTDNALAQRANVCPGTVRRWRRRHNISSHKGQQQTQAKQAPRKPPKLVEFPTDPVELAAFRLRECRQRLAIATADRSWTAAAALTRVESELVVSLQRARDAAKETASMMSDEQLAEALANAVGQIAEPFLVKIEEAIELRRGGLVNLDGERRKRSKR